MRSASGGYTLQRYDPQYYSFLATHCRSVAATAAAAARVTHPWPTITLPTSISGVQRACLRLLAPPATWRVSVVSRAVRAIITTTNNVITDHPRSGVVYYLVVSVCYSLCMSVRR